MAKVRVLWVISSIFFRVCAPHRLFSLIAFLLLFVPFFSHQESNWRRGNAHCDGLVRHCLRLDWRTTHDDQRRDGTSPGLYRDTL